MTRGRDEKGETTLNRAPFNQHSHNGGHKDNKVEREPPVGSPGSKSHRFMASWEESSQPCLSHSAKLLATGITLARPPPDML